VVLGFGAGAGVVTGGLKAARTSMLSSLYVLVVLGFGAGAGVVPAFLKATKTAALSSIWFCFGADGVVGFGFATGAAKAFGSTLKPAASVKVKMSFLYKAISLKI
jgi:hypothetical protein